MALGDKNGGSSKLYENTYYSRIRFKDYENKLVLGFSFNKGMIIADISREKDGFQYESVAQIYITATKAKILLSQIAKFKEDLANGLKDANIGYGINAGLGEIVSILAVHVTAAGNKAVTIGKVDGDGNYKEKVTFTFSKQNIYGLKWSDVESMKVGKEFEDEIEFEQFIEVIAQFATASTGAIGYSTIDIARYDYKALMNKMHPIDDKLGIERNNYNGRGGSGNNFFNNNGSKEEENKSSQHKSVDDLYSSLEDDD